MHYIFQRYFYIKIIQYLYYEIKYLEYVLKSDVAC